MRCRPVTLASAASLALCAASLHFWFRSETAFERAHYDAGRPGQRRVLAVLSWNGQVQFEQVRGVPGEDYGVGVSGRSGRWGWYRKNFRPDEDMTEWERGVSPLVSDTSLTGLPRWPAHTAWVVAYGREPLPRTGFADQRKYYDPATPPPPARSIAYVRVPYWLVAGTFGVAPAVWLVAAAVRGRRRRSRRAAGLCPACGYDLRATAGKCPECGTGRVANVPA